MSNRERISFGKEDQGVPDELKQAETILRSGLSVAVDDVVIAFMLADVIGRWRFVAGLDPDLLNRVGGPETVALARYVNKKGSLGLTSDAD